MNLSSKIKIMVKQGFKKYVSRMTNTITFEYKGNIWTLDQVKDISIAIILRYKKWYDGYITNLELQRAIVFDRKYRKIHENLALG